MSSLSRSQRGTRSQLAMVGHGEESSSLLGLDGPQSIVEVGLTAESRSLSSMLPG